MSSASLITLQSGNSVKEEMVLMHNLTANRLHSIPAHDKSYVSHCEGKFLHEHTIDITVRILIFLKLFLDRSFSAMLGKVSVHVIHPILRLLSSLITCAVCLCSPFHWPPDKYQHRVREHKETSSARSSSLSTESREVKLPVQYFFRNSPLTNTSHFK